MRNAPRLLAALAGTAAMTAAVPALASAATVTLDKPCYGKVPGGASEPIVASVTGGTPNANFQVIFTVPGKASGSAGSMTGTFDATGSGTVTYANISTPTSTINPSKGQTVLLSVTDFGAGGVETPVGQFKVSTVSIDVSTKPRNPRSKRAVKVSATPFAGQTVYAFVTKTGSSKVLKKFRVGKTNECGYAERRAVVAPSSYRTGNYRLWINPGPSLKKDKALYYTFRIFRSAF